MLNYIKLCAKVEKLILFYPLNYLSVSLFLPKIRGYQNTCSTPGEVIERCLNDLFMKLREHKPGCTENDLRSHINWFITHEEGYIDKRIARVAKAEPYNGKVIPDRTTQNN